MRIFRIQVDYTFKKLIRVFKLDTIFESQSVSEDVLEKNQIFEKLTLLKLRLEYMSEVSLAKYYMQKTAPTVVSKLNAIINEKHIINEVFQPLHFNDVIVSNSISHGRAENLR